jgi:2-hydroxychromene-2-carboxylate isomerase
VTTSPSPPGAATAPSALDFWFDFISPYGFLASLRIDAIAARHGREVNWHPVLIGVTVMKIMRMPPVMETPLKRDYVPREIARYCRRHGVVLARPLDKAPMSPLPAGRVLAWLLKNEPWCAKSFARRVLRDYWSGGIDVDTREALRESASHAAVPHAVIEAALDDPQAGALLRTEVDQAVGRGVFGSPFILVDGEPFFGVDKLELLDDWLSRGGW